MVDRAVGESHGAVLEADDPGARDLAGNGGEGPGEYAVLWQHESATSAISQKTDEPAGSGDGVEPDGREMPRACQPKGEAMNGEVPSVRTDVSRQVIHLPLV